MRPGLTLAESTGPLALTGPVVVGGVTALAALAFVLGIWWVPRVLRARGTGRVRAVLVQAVTLILCTALVMVATGVWLNRAFVFYGSWSDLFDSGSTQMSTHLYGSAAGQGTVGGAIGADADPAGTAVPLTAAEQRALTAARTAPATALQADPQHDPALAGVTDARGGQDVWVTIPASASDVTQQAIVHLPAGYMQHPDHRYPVLLAFTGIPGSPETWEQAFDLGGRLDDLASRDKIASAIVVIPIVYPGADDTECVDPSHGPGRYETWLSQDVPAWVHEHLRTIEDPFAWATIGYSAGGWCASMLSVRHPDLARASISLGGYFVVDYAKGQQRTAPDDPRYDLPALVAHERPPVVMYFFSGGEDRLTEPTLGEMSQAVQPPTALTVRRTRYGGHMLTLWVAQLPISLGWLAGHEAGFTPTPR